MNVKAKSAPRIRRSKPLAAVAAGPSSCLRCPACGTEECRTLQDLGMYCDTVSAASLAARVVKRPKPKPAAA